MAESADQDPGLPDRAGWLQDKARLTEHRPWLWGAGQALDTTRPKDTDGDVSRVGWRANRTVGESGLHGEGFEECCPTRYFSDGQEVAASV